jgi:membrane carboxypeptidase/penicillin-binding protein
MTIDGLRTMPLLRRILVAAAALAGGTSPVSSIGGLRDAVVEAREGAWIPRDRREQSPDALTLRDALDSNNAAAVLLQQRIGHGSGAAARAGPRRP